MAVSMPPHYAYTPGFPGISVGKESPAMRETWVRSLDWEAPLEEGMATHSSILAWRILMNLEGYCPWSFNESDITERLSAAQHMSTQQLPWVSFLTSSPTSSRSVPRSLYGTCTFAKWILFSPLPVLYFLRRFTVSV